MLAAITGVMTIIDHFTSTPFFSLLLSRHVTSTPRGYEISAGFNFLITISLGGAVWLSVAGDEPPADPSQTKKLAWKRIYLAAAAMAAWLILGPAIRREPRAAAEPEAAPRAESPAPAAPRNSPFGLRPLYRQTGGVGSRE